jgi:formiminotetrahydrofolate cyclodeaminase
MDMDSLLKRPKPVWEPVTDARSQQEYFCDMTNAANDSMVALGTACRNAKINVKEACEGVVLPDTQYESCVMEQTC